MYPGVHGKNEDEVWEFLEDLVWKIMQCDSPAESPIDQLL